MASRKMTRSDFMDSFEQDYACYIYYTDKNHVMHFISDNPAHDITDAECFTTDVNEALLIDITYAEKLKFLCDFLFDNRVHHIVQLHTRVEWL